MDSDSIPKEHTCRIEEKVESLMADVGRGKYGVYTKVENRWRCKLKSLVIAACREEFKLGSTAHFKHSI